MVKFIDPTNVVAQAELKPGYVVADFGCGSGFYALPAAEKVGNTGIVYAIDVQEAKLAATQSAARQKGLKNINSIKADLDKPLLDIAENSCDLVILASIIHEIESPDSLLKNAYRLLKSGGQLLAVEWKKEATPLGPDIARRIGQQELEQLLLRAGFHKNKDLQTDGFHYSVIFTK